MLRIVLGHDKPVGILLHILVVPSLDAEVGGLFAVKIDEGEAFGVLLLFIDDNLQFQSDLDKTYDCGKYKVVHTGLSLFLQSIVPKNQVQLFNDLLLGASGIELSNVDAGVLVVIAVLAVMNHVESSIVELKRFFKKDSMSHCDH